VIHFLPKFCLKQSKNVSINIIFIDYSRNIVEVVFKRVWNLSRSPEGVWHYCKIDSKNYA